MRDRESDGDRERDRYMARDGQRAMWKIAIEREKWEADRWSRQRERKAPTVEPMSYRHVLI